MILPNVQAERWKRRASVTESDAITSNDNLETRTKESHRFQTSLFFVVLISSWILGIRLYTTWYWKDGALRPDVNGPLEHFPVQSLQTPALDGNVVRPAVHDAHAAGSAKVAFLPPPGRRVVVTVDADIGRACRVGGGGGGGNSSGVRNLPSRRGQQNPLVLLQVVSSSSSSSSSIQVERRENGRDPKRRGALSPALETVADKDLQGLGQRRREADGAALASAFH